MLEKIYEKSDAAYETTIGYLRQEGLLDNVRYAIVDSGWVGTIHNLDVNTREEIIRFIFEEERKSRKKERLN